MQDCICFTFLIYDLFDCTMIGGQYLKVQEKSIKPSAKEKMEDRNEEAFQWETVFGEMKGACYITRKHSED